MDKYLGKLLGGRYEIIDVVGVGGMAVVYRARCHVLNRYVAVKILKDEYAKDPDIRRRFSIESQAVAKLSHHNIVSVYDVGSDDGVDYIVMELMEGVTLKEYLQKKGCLPWQEALFFAQQICRALMHAHSRGIIHQDIKPQNVIILRDGTAKLTDFGIASFATTQETRVVQEAIGSVHYISPEQAKGSTIDYRTDIYSLGVVMYEMLTGKLPFEGDTALQVVMQHLSAVPLPPSELQPGLPRGLDDIVMHAMCANINKRYASAEELCTDLERLKSDENAEFHYAAPPDAGETQVLSPEVRDAARRTPVSPARDRGAAPQRRETAAAVREPEGFFEKLGERPGLAAIVAVSVFTVIALIVAGVLIVTGNSGGEKVSVPPFVGENIDSVLADPDYTSQFSIREAEKRVESRRPVGEVLEQDPVPGSKVAVGTIITLTVSAGGDKVDDSYKIVDFKGKPIDYVTEILGEHDVAFQQTREPSDEVEKDRVTRTDPPAGETLPKGQTLTIYVSAGKQTEETEVPDLSGSTEEEARKALEAAGLKLGSVNRYESAAPVGTIYWQAPAKGEKAVRGAEVNVQISLGKTQPPAPDEPDEPVEPDEPDNGEGGEGGEGGETEPPAPATGRASIPVVLPPDTEEVHVIITLNGGVLYDQVHSSASGTVTPSVTGPVGSHEVQISVNGEVRTYTATFN